MHLVSTALILLAILCKLKKKGVPRDFAFYLNVHLDAVQCS